MGIYYFPASSGQSSDNWDNILAAKFFANPINYQPNFSEAISPQHKVVYCNVSSNLCKVDTPNVRHTFACEWTQGYASKMAGKNLVAPVVSQTFRYDSCYGKIEVVNQSLCEARFINIVI